MKKNKDNLTSFQKHVYAATKKIPRGKVTTYKYLAEHLGCGSSQAIGQALKGNPYAPVVPCHRVIRTDLTIGGFAGHSEGKEIQRKKRLLSKEGVRFTGDRLCDPDRVFSF